MSAVILSFNRRGALGRTLRELSRLSAITQTVVVDNASTDGTPAMLAAEFPGVRLLALDRNVGVAGFNRGVELASEDLLLILDDDSWPDAASLAAAMGAMSDERSRADAVALAPMHPATRVCEWPFLRAPARGFPFMGCANLVRAEAWRRVGGYEEAFFLYRNDVDLALKILATGGEVLADPAWFAWHDSPAAAVKSERWLELATRNWCWLARRHAGVIDRGVGMLAGIGRAGLHALAAAPRVPRLARVLSGARAGALGPRPPLPQGCPASRDGYARMLRWRR